MKRILTVTLALALATFVFSSCSKDKKEKESNTLEGTTWVSSFTGPDFPGEAALIFATSGNGFELLVRNLKVDQIVTLKGEYTFNTPKISFDVYEIIKSKAPVPTPEIKFSFLGSVVGETLEVDLSNVVGATLTFDKK